MAKKVLITRKQLNAFIPKFNGDHKFTKIVGVKTNLSGMGKDKRSLMCWVLDIRVSSYRDMRKKLCNFRLNVWPEETTLEKVGDTINDMYDGMRDFLDCNDGIEEQVITKKKTQPELVAA